MRNMLKKSKIMKIFNFVIYISFLIILSNIVYADYNSSILGNEWFNNEVLVENTIAGVLLYIFIVMILIGLIIFSEYSQIPAIMFLSGLLAFFMGFLFYVVISAIIGFLFIIMSILYVIRSIVALKE